MRVTIQCRSASYVRRSRRWYSVNLWAGRGHCVRVSAMYNHWDALQLADQWRCAGSYRAERVHDEIE